MTWKRLAFVVALSGSLVASADVVHLRDGTKLEGTVRRVDDLGWVVATPDGKTTRVPGDQIDSIEVRSAAPVSSMVRLDSLRHATDNVDDPKDAVVQYQRFIEKDRDPAATVEAKKDLLMWQDRVARGYTRVAGKWVPPLERAKLLDQANVTAEHARQMIKQGRSQEAAPMIADTLAADPQNVTALYLSGLLAYDQDKLPSARKAFEAVSALVPNHAPTLTNLAVIQFRQKQYVAAMINFDAAMQAAPVNKSVLDDVATAVQQWPTNMAKNAAVTRTERRFADQDATLAQRLAAVGLHRVGATWVDNIDADKARQRDQQAAAQLDQLAGEFDQAADRIRQIDQSANDTSDQIHRIESQSTAIDPRTGALITVPFPPSYNNLKQDLQRMSRDRGVSVAQLDGIRRQAQMIQNARNEQQGIGILRLIGPDGTPFKSVPVAAPAAAPSTQPAV